MSPIKTAINFILLAASAVAAPLDTNASDSGLFRRQDYVSGEYSTRYQNYNLTTARPSIAMQLHQQRFLTRED